MLRRIGRLLSSNLVAFVALFFALSGAAYALPGLNTVDSGDIVNNAVSTLDIKASTITGGDVKPNTLTGDDIDESTLSIELARRCGQGVVAGYAEIDADAAIGSSYDGIGITNVFNCAGDIVSVRQQGGVGSYRLCFHSNPADVAIVNGMATSAGNDNIVTWSRVDDTAASCPAAFQVNIFDQDGGAGTAQNADFFISVMV